MNSPDRPVALVVEDDDHIAHLLRFMLEREGYQVVHAADGREGLNLIENGALPAIALLDVMLPFVDGFELVRRLKKSARHEFIAVAFSAAVTPEAQAQALEAGFAAFLAKPLQAKELLETMQKLQSAHPSTSAPYPNGTGHAGITGMDLGLN